VVLTAVLYYFGWSRSAAYFGYFGISTGQLQFNTADYVLRSIDTALPSLAATALLLVAVIETHHRLLKPVLTRHSNWLQIAVTILHVAGYSMAAVAVAHALFPRQIAFRLALDLPLVLVTATCLLGYARMLARGGNLPPADSPVIPSVLLLLGSVGLLWAIAIYGGQVGRAAAAATHRNLPEASEVRVYSTQRLSIHAGAGVQVDTLAAPGNRYHYRYSGLRLLVETSDNQFLLPQDWHRGQDPVFVIRKDEETRVDLIAPR
jgi:hypothetical protein